MPSMIKGGVRELYPKHQFLVQISGIGWAGFQKCSELSMEVAKIEYYEGGSAIPWKVPGRATITDVTLERGTSSSLAFFNWAVQVLNASIAANKGATRGTGQVTPGYLRDAIIQQLDRDGSKVREWRCSNAWVQKFMAGDWDNTADEVTIESLTLTFDFFTLKS